MTITHMSKRSSSPRSVKSGRSEPESTLSTDSPESETQRVSFSVRADGTIDADSLRSATREKLRKVFTDPALPSALGIAAPASAQSVEDAAVMQSIAGGLYDGLSALSIALARRAGYTIEQARVLVFTTEEKTALADPTARVIDKYFPDFGGRYRDEIMLAFLLTNIMGGKIMMLRAAGSVVASPRPVTEETPAETA